MPKPKLDPDQWDDAMRRYVAGEVVTEIAAYYSVSPSAIQKHASRHGFRRKTAHRIKIEGGYKRRAERQLAKTPPMPPRPKVAVPIVYSQTTSEIVRLHTMGRSRSEIGALLRMPYRDIDAALALRG